MHCVDLGESFQTHIHLQNLASIQPRTSPLKFAGPLKFAEPSNVCSPDLLFPEEEAPGLLQAEEEAEAHEKSDVTDREAEAIEDEHDAQEKAEHA